MTMVLFQNRQWQVTQAGLEPVDPIFGVLIPKSQLLSVRCGQSGSLYEWPIHVAEKSWIDIGAFEEAYLFALERSQDRFDQTMLDRSLGRGREIAHLRQQLNPG